MNYQTGYDDAIKGFDMRMPFDNDYKQGYHDGNDVLDGILAAKEPKTYQHNYAYGQTHPFYEDAFVGYQNGVRKALEQPALRYSNMSRTYNYAYDKGFQATATEQIEQATRDAFEQCQRHRRFNHAMLATKTASYQQGYAKGVRAYTKYASIKLSKRITEVMNVSWRYKKPARLPKPNNYPLRPRKWQPDDYIYHLGIQITVNDRVIPFTKRVPRGYH